MVLGEAGGDPDGNEQGHHPHAEVERQHQRIAMIERKLQPGAGKAPRRIRRKRRKDKYQQKRADDHKGQGGDKTVADRGHVFCWPIAPASGVICRSITSINLAYRELMIFP